MMTSLHTNHVIQPLSRKLAKPRQQPEEDKKEQKPADPFSAEMVNYMNHPNSNDDVANRNPHEISSSSSSPMSSSTTNNNSHVGTPSNAAPTMLSGSGGV